MTSQLWSTCSHTTRSTAATAGGKGITFGLLRLADKLGLRLERAEVNREPGAVVFDPAGRLVSVLSIEIAEGRIRELRSIVNPGKLRHLGPVGDWAKIFGGAD